jgi:hypothetical protein
MLIHHTFKDGLLSSKIALVLTPLLGYLLVIVSPPSRVTFRVGGVRLVNGGEQPPCDRLYLIGGSFYVDRDQSVP